MNQSQSNAAPLIKLIIFILLLGGLIYYIVKSNSKPNSATNSTESNVCRRCGGTGSVATYGYCTDPVNHFHGDCNPETHTEACTASGSKTCPCCNGIGKVN